jgi:hypothetical protein
VAAPAVQPATRAPQPLPLALAAILVVTTVGMLEVRFDEKWGSGVHLALAAVAFAGLFFLGTRERHADAPPVYQSVLLVSAMLLLLQAVFRLGDVVKEDPLESSITIAWMAGLFAAVAALAALRYGSAVCALFAALGLVTTVLALLDEVTEGLDAEDFRLYLSLLAVAFGAAAAWLRRQGRPRHAVQLVNAAAIVLIGVAVTIFVEGVFGAFAETFGGDEDFGEDGEPGFATDSGWELVLMIGSFWIIAYGGLRREPGPMWLGALLLTLSITIAAAPKDPDEATIVGWPLVAIILTGVAFWMAYNRPSAGGTPAGPGPGGHAPPGAGAPPPGAQPTAPGFAPPSDAGAQPTAPGFAPPAGPDTQPVAPGKIPPPGPPPGSVPPPGGPPA